MTYVLVWLAVTATAVFVAAAAVGSVRDQVTETPAAMVPTTSTITASTSGSSVPTTAVDASSSTTTTTTPSANSTTTTAAAPTTTTTTPSKPAPTTTTTSAPATTTTTVPPPTDIRSYDLIGGVVTVEIGSSAVRLAGASPKSGFRMEVENSGPKKVEVEFKSNEHESKFSGEFKDGTFVPEIEESDREEDDD